MAGTHLEDEKRPNGEERMIKKAVKMIYNNRSEGDIITDAPTTTCWQELLDAAQDRNKWRLRVRSIKDLICIAAIKTKGKKKGKSRKGKGTDKKKNKKSRPKWKWLGTGIDAVAVPIVYSDQSSSEEEEEEGSAAAAPAATNRPAIRGLIKCKDGFTMSVQASSDHACTPRDNTGPYAAVEIGYPSELEPLLMPFRDAPQLYTSIEPTLFVNVCVSRHSARSDPISLWTTFRQCTTASTNRL